MLYSRMDYYCALIWRVFLFCSDIVTWLFRFLGFVLWNLVFRFNGSFSKRKTMKSRKEKKSILLHYFCHTHIHTDTHVINHAFIGHRHRTLGKGYWNGHRWLDRIMNLERFDWVNLRRKMNEYIGWIEEKNFNEFGRENHYCLQGLVLCVYFMVKN